MLPNLPVDAGVNAKLDAFLDLLLTWNRRINLISEADPAAIRQRHIEDSIQLSPLIPDAGPVADLGSGAGFPGLILAIASPRRIHLVESDQRKVAFLTEAAARLILPHVTIHPARIEAVRLPPLTAITARALAPLGTLLAHAARLLQPGGVAVFPKGRTAEAELAAAARHWTFRLDRFPSRTARDSVILRFTQIRAK